MGRLERHLDMDAVRRVLAGIRFKDEPMKHKTKAPRPAMTFRAARRNKSRALDRIDRKCGGLGWRGIKPYMKSGRCPNGYIPHPPVRENKRDRRMD